MVLRQNLKSLLSGIVNKIKTQICIGSRLLPPPPENTSCGPPIKYPQKIFLVANSPENAFPMESIVLKDNKRTKYQEQF